MKTITYLSALTGWIIGGIFSCLVLEYDFSVTIGGIAGMTVLYFLSKLK